MKNRRAATCVAAQLACSLAGCAHQGATPEWRERPGTSEARLYYYRDDQGLSVVTAGASVEQAVSRRVAVSAQGLVDRIVVEHPEQVHQDSGGQPTGHGHDDVDVITSASVTVTGGDRLVKTRYQGIAGVSVDTGLTAGPTRVQASSRVSTEPDYKSYSGRLGVTAEFFERNTTLSLFIGYGYDTVDPIEVPPGEVALWPAAHDRWNAGVMVSQILTPRVVLYGGAAGNHQAGTLSNPYRRALIRTSLFPERLPSKRDRFTGFISLAWYLGWDTALHVRQGAYVDSWDLKALIPELKVVKELGDRGLLALKYRFYWQTAASFYAPSYDDLELLRTGDVRLGRLINHVPGADFSWTVLGRRGGFGALTLGAGYTLSLLDYREISRFVVGHIGTVVVSASY
jgi:Protein of unknown function (DUF3570)